MTYYLAMERTDGSMDRAFHETKTKKKALTVARHIAKKSSWDCVALWVEDSEENGIIKFVLPEWMA
jgi:hypothetical protein